LASGSMRQCGKGVHGKAGLPSPAFPPHKN
jgi:hypothetical protein